MTKRKNFFIFPPDDSNKIQKIDTPRIIDTFIEDTKEFVKIDKQINSLLDLIELGKMYDPTKKYNFNIEQLNLMVPSLTELYNMIGMQKVKDEIVDHVLFYIQKLDKESSDMMHTLIQGPPGVGKTEVAKIIGRIYNAMGILKTDKFIKASRNNLIGQYLGQTAPLTQKVINSAIGGVLFIDEVYSLGNAEKRDSYAKECIDTINENLTDKKTDFICIVAGYKDDIMNCFLSYNQGLDRRFPVRFTIEPYTGEELYLIFKKKANDFDWFIGDDIDKTFFIDNYKCFKNYGGDMEILFSRCKRAYSRRTFTLNDKTKIINMNDLKEAHKYFAIDNKKEQWLDMFL
jgi:SpoVK/Ycf46/Vps4 family AAA+-type ATPase